MQAEPSRLHRVKTACILTIIMDILKQLRDVCLMNAGLEFIVDTDASGEELETIPLFTLRTDQKCLKWLH